MKSTHYRRDDCRLCGSRNLELVLPLKPSALADSYIPASKLNEPQPRYSLDTFLCRDCGHVQLLDVVNPEILFSHYLYTTSVSLGLVEHFRRYADAVIAELSPAKDSLVIDIGSNEGVLLKFFRERGMKVLGVDAAKNIAELAKSRHGIDTIATFFNLNVAKQIKKDYGPAKIVTANNVFAHADNLGEMLDGIRELLASDGVFVFEVVYLADVLQKFTFDTIYHEHLCAHSVKPFVLFCERHGMELFHVERIATKGGSIRGFAQLKGGPRKVSNGVRDLLKFEQEIGLDKPQVFHDYFKKIEAVKTEVKTLLERLKKEGKKIAGYGASATVTTLVHHFEIGELIEFIADDDASRHGLYSPGYHIPITSSQALYDKKPDYVVILAWQYAEPIMKKHPQYLQNGGHFIIPLPSVRII